MAGVLIRSNLTCSDQVRYFSNQWSDHLDSQVMGWLTDMRMVAREGNVEVHRAVILPLCPLLGVMDNDLTQEDPAVIFPGHPLELLQAFVNLIYKGSTMMSEVVTVGNLLELMSSLGLNMPVNCLVIDRVREEVYQEETIGYKKLNGLEIFEVNKNSTHLPLPHDHTLEITSCLLNSTLSSQSAQHQLSNPVLPPERKLVGKAVSRTKMEMKASESNNSGQTDRHKILNPIVRERRPVEVKLESEEFIVEDVKPPISKKGKWNRRRETLDIALHSCEFCDFKCRFVQSLQEHCDTLHRDKQFKCDKCQVVASSFARLRDHKRKRHVGHVCEICGFGTKKKRELAWHRLNIHGAREFQVRSDKLFNNGREGSFHMQEICSETSDENLKLGVAKDVVETTLKESPFEANVLETSEEILYYDIDSRNTVDEGSWDSTLEETGYNEEQAIEGLSIHQEKNENRVEHSERKAGVESKLKDKEVDVMTPVHVEEDQKLGELVEVECGEVEANNPTFNQNNKENPLQILQKVKVTYRQTSRASLSLENSKPVEVKKAKKRLTQKPNVETNSIINLYNQAEDEPKAHPAQNVFKFEWLDPKNLLFDINGDRLSTYLSPVPSSPSMAICLVCKISFSISVLGVGEVYRHARLAGHKEGIRRLRSEVGWMRGFQGGLNKTFKDVSADKKKVKDSQSYCLAKK